MSVRLVPGLGDPIYEVAGPDTIALPNGFASGRQITYRRTDPGTSTVTIQAVGGDVLNGTANSSVTLSTGSTVVFRSVDPGQWQSSTEAGGSGTAALSTVAQARAVAAAMATALS